MESIETLLLSRNDVAKLLTIEECMVAVEQAFKLFACGETQAPGILGFHVSEGGFHLKAGILYVARNYFVAKINANFPDNTKKHGLPTIQGIITVFDADDGRLLAIMDSIEITIMRTGAATAIAARYLSREDSETVTICGCGNQGRISLRAIMRVRSLKTAFAFDINKSRADQFATELSEELNIKVYAVEDLGKAVRLSDICITCTPSKQPFLQLENIKPGSFIAAVGADSEEKRELFPEILTTAKVVVDLLEQSKNIGELHHALKTGAFDIHAELGEIITGKKTARESEKDIFVFDSTGMALQDAAAAAIVYEKAIVTRNGATLSFNV